jgi:hypothetical protein
LYSPRHAPISLLPDRTTSESKLGGDEIQTKKETTMKKSFVLGAIAALALGSALVSAQPAAAADGCGPSKYRGPGGYCHRLGYGPYPNGYSGPVRNAPRANGCPPGYWRGPWGHCRNTPYHGRLPNGSWK